MTKSRHGLLSILAMTLLSNCVAMGRDAPPPAGCIARRDISSDRVVNAREIEFRLKDRRVLRNTMAKPCRNLSYVGEFRIIAGGAAVCPGDEILVPNRSRGAGEPEGDYCSLGTFAPR